MNGSGSVSLLTKDAKCSQMFICVFACDRLPTRINADHGPALMICNTDTHDMPGEHWIAIYIEHSSYGEYFDSFGRTLRGNLNHFLINIVLVGFSMIYNYKAKSVISVDIIAYFSVCIVVEIETSTQLLIFLVPLLDLMIIWYTIMYVKLCLNSPCSVKNKP